MLKNIFLLFFLISHFCFSQSEFNNSLAKSIDIENYVIQNKPYEYIIDLTSLLDSIQVENLEQKLKNYNKETTNEILVSIIDLNKLNENNFDDFAVYLSNSSYLSEKEKSNKLTIILSPKLRKIRISTTKVIEKILTDEICQNIIDSVIVPEFKNGDYYEGLNKGIDELIKHWK